MGMEVKPLAIILFLLIVGLVLFISFWTARRAKSASGYYAAGGRIHWGVNGIAFAGDYLSAASFLGICGLIATTGYDGFLYSIGYLAGWVVALFVVAEPLRRLGKYTFTDAMDSKFDKRGLKLWAAIATLIVSIFYLIPQMVGAGVLIEPLLGLPQWAGVVMVGAIVITIVATAGMTSTTYVQFIKGALLITFALVITIALFVRGLSTEPDQGGAVPFHTYETLAASVDDSGDIVLDDAQDSEKYDVLAYDSEEEPGFVQLGFAAEVEVTVDDTTTTETRDIETWWKVVHEKVTDADGNEVDGPVIGLHETQEVVTLSDSTVIINGVPESEGSVLRQVGNLPVIAGNSTNEEGDGPYLSGGVNPFKYLALVGDEGTKVNLWKKASFDLEDGTAVSVYYENQVPGEKIMRPGAKFKLDEGSVTSKIDFISLMIALFLGTASLPHILIRYYTVPSQRAARKSTVVAIAAIGFFYILTLFLGLGAMSSATVNPLDNNMSAPLLAESFGTFLFAMISAIAFATVLGTVSGLIVAASGAVAHDLLDRFGGRIHNEKQKVLSGRIAAFGIGAVAILLGIAFQGVNVSFLVGLAFAVAASANLPGILMMLFWKRTTSKGMIASIIVGIVLAVGIILLSPTAWELYGLDPANAPIPLRNPGIISIPASFIAIYLVSKLTKRDMLEEHSK